jgi:hypothetical protein
MSTGDTLEGRALSTTGAVTVDGVFAFTPIGCGSSFLIGPAAPELASTECYAIFSSNGAVSNSGISFVTGDIGTNNGLTTGFDSVNVSGNIHFIPDASTAQCALDLGIMYTYLNTLSHDIELLYPAEFGNNLVLTPHTYLLDAATVFTDSLFLDAQGYVDAVFVIKINGALSTSTYSKVILRNGAQAKNVFWKIDGAVSLNNYSVFCGTIVCNNGAMGAFNTGVVLNGKAFTTGGALTTTAINATTTPNCNLTDIYSLDYSKERINIYPSPFQSTLFIDVSEESLKAEFSIYNTYGQLVLNKEINNGITQIAANLPSGIYFYQVTTNNKLIQSGKLVSAN